VTANPPRQSREMDGAPERANRPRSWWLSPAGLVTLGFLAVAGYFLITEHRAHLALALPWLSWLLVAACPLMHLLMHHGHHVGHDHSSGHSPALGPEENP